MQSAKIQNNACNNNNKKNYHTKTINTDLSLEYLDVKESKCIQVQMGFSTQSTCWLIHFWLELFVNCLRRVIRYITPFFAPGELHCKLHIQLEKNIIYWRNGESRGTLKNPIVTYRICYKTYEYKLAAKILINWNTIKYHPSNKNQ